MSVTSVIKRFVLPALAAGIIGMASGSARATEPLRKNQGYFFKADTLDRYGSMSSGAENMYNARLALGQLAIEPLADYTEISNHWWSRLPKALFDELLTLYTGGVTHEVWGHGAKDREYGVYCSHDMRLWQGGFGQSYSCGGTILTEKEDISSIIGGMESTQYFGYHVGHEMFFRGGNYTRALMYVDVKGDTANYILNWGNPDIHFWNPHEVDYLPPYDGNDVADYWLRMSYQQFEQLKKNHSLSEISQQGLWNGPNFSYRTMQFGAVWTLIDPTLLYSLYEVGKYIVTGSRDFTLPNFMPNTSFLLSENGPEFYLRLPFRVGNSDFMFIEPYARMTGNYSDNTYGGGVYTETDLPYDFGGYFTTSLRAGTDIWKQPDRWGVGGRLGFDVIFPFETPLYLGIDLYGKTTGHIFAQPEKAGFYGSFRLGIGVPINEERPN